MKSLFLFFIFFILISNSLIVDAPIVKDENLYDIISISFTNSQIIIKNIYKDSVRMIIDYSKILDIKIEYNQIYTVKGIDGNNSLKIYANSVLVYDKMVYFAPLITESLIGAIIQYIIIIITIIGIVKAIKWWFYDDNV